MNYRNAVRELFRFARVFLYYARRYKPGDPVRAAYVETARRHVHAARAIRREFAEV